MSRLSIRRRTFDIHKKLPIVSANRDFDDDETLSSLILRLTAEANELQEVTSRKAATEIPTPQFRVVDTYEHDYSRTFSQPTSYIHAKGARAKTGEFVEYDLDNEDDDWLEELNMKRKVLGAEMLETIIYKLEVLDHEARESAGVVTPSTSAPTPVVLAFDAAIEAIRGHSIKYGIFQSVYNYWKGKRERWRKPVLRCLQVQMKSVKKKRMKCHWISDCLKSNSSAKPMEQSSEKMNSDSSDLSSDSRAVCGLEVNRLGIRDTGVAVSVSAKEVKNGTTASRSSSHIVLRAEDILKVLSSHGCASEVRIRQLLGDNPSTSKALRMLLKLEVVQRSGAGGRTDPYMYTIA